MDWKLLSKRIRKRLFYLGIIYEQDDIIQDVFEWFLKHNEKQSSKRLDLIIIDVLRSKYGRKGRLKWASGLKRPIEFDDNHGCTPPMSTTLLDFDLIFDKLTEQDQYVLCRLLQGATQLEISKELELDSSRICQIMDRLFDRVRSTMIRSERSKYVKVTQSVKRKVKLNESQRLCIRKSSKKLRELAAQYGVSISTIHNIKRS